MVKPRTLRLAGRVASIGMMMMMMIIIIIIIMHLGLGWKVRRKETTCKAKT
jgi:hypothetical protein